MKDKNEKKVLVFLKPDCTIRRPVSAKVLKSFIDNDFKIIAFKEVTVNNNLAEKHYEEHKGKFFYPWLCKMLQLSPVVAMILEEDPDRIRNFIGNTFCHQAEKTTLRGKYGIYGGVNSIHASDSLASAERELELWGENLGLLPEKSNVKEKIIDYINKWDRELKTDLSKIRELCNKIKSDPENINVYRDQLKSDLLNDCKEFIEKDSKILDRFVDIIIENILL
ncbi:MAG: nucleoside-diphosphate kinase [Candidatus Helarchaeota archaeon]